MGDRRRTSLKLSEEAFEYLAEEQENRPVTTRQDTVEAVIQEHMDLTAEEQAADAEPSRFAVQSYDLAVGSFQLSLVGVISTAVSTLALPAWQPALGVFTATAAFVTVVAALAAGVAARADLGGVSIRDTLLDQQEVATDGGQPTEEE